jgi:hypothetical protein
MSQRAWDTYAEQEAQALATLLSTEGRCVLVVVVAAHSDELGTTSLMHAVAGQTMGSHLRQFIAGMERKTQWLRAKLTRRA